MGLVSDTYLHFFGITFLELFLRDGINDTRESHMMPLPLHEYEWLFRDARQVFEQQCQALIQTPSLGAFSIPSYSEKMRPARLSFEVQVGIAAVVIRSEK